ncbi:MAG: chromosome segregation protein SMC [Acidobacteriota bacterium]
MFRLKKLEIQGFKSFVERTSVTLPSRITAIVGPNGSGKSNICDAVQWVLGEQSARNLRGTTMEDVIFNGAAHRRPLGMAEVAITLESRGGDQWLDSGGELVLTRRVTRDGESDYIVNGKKSRLKDVQEILTGTGLGVRAYSIIEQQKIDLILSTKPQDRRRLIEEAAGVSKYKIRKRQAEVKLEETRGNLLRLTDIVSEIDRTCTSLKRQASRAARWKEQADVLAAQKKRLARLRADRLSTGFAGGEAALRAATDAEAAALAELSRLEAGLVEARRLADEDERAVREAGDALARARETALAAGAAVAAAQREAEEAAARQELLEAQRRESEADHGRYVEESGRTLKAREEAEAALAEASAEVTAAAQALADVSAREADVTGRREASRRDLLAAGGRSAEATNREREAALLVDRLGFALAKLEERHARATELVEERRKATAEADALLAAASTGLESARRHLEDASHGRRAAEDRLATLKALREAHVAALHAVDVRAAALETTLAAREAGGESARRALEAARLEPHGVLADHFDAAPGFEKALDAALGAALEAPVLDTRAALDAALAAVREKKLGAARFVHPLPETPFPLKPKDPRVLGIARELLVAKSSGAPSSALPDAVVVANVDDALALASLHPERTLVTTDGVVVRGAVVEAAGTEVPGEGLFIVRRDLRNLAGERAGIAAKRVEAEAEIGTLAEQVGTFAATLDAALAMSRGAERAHSEAEAKAAGARTEEERAALERRVLGEEDNALRQDLAKAGESRAEAQRLASQRQAEMATVERTLSELETALDGARAARLASAETDAAARNARDVLVERASSLASASAAAEGRARDAARRVAELADALVEVGDRGRQALTAGEGFRAAHAAAAIAATDAELRRAAADVAADTRRGARVATEAEATASREALDATRRLRFEAELGLERRKADQDHLVEQCRNEFGCLPGELPTLERSEAEQALTGEDLEAALAGDVTTRSLALERLGPVNHAALEEYEVESKRLAELSGQKADLEASLAQILETIKTINLTSSERFQEAFAAVNFNFGQVFQRLFHGGTASMHLLDENDPLDSGLEIMAQPPGKRNQTIGLLSGGEKALTAVALLVAIFKYKPSPFCILDEVDAPLDEANIDRFTSLLVELSEETQFVLITHNKRTMETAQALYGVTQEEPGVSKLVSVRFD